MDDLSLIGNQRNNTGEINSPDSLSLSFSVEIGVEESQGDRIFLDYFNPHSTKTQEFFRFHPQLDFTNPVIL